MSVGGSARLFAFICISIARVEERLETSFMPREPRVIANDRIEKRKLRLYGGPGANLNSEASMPLSFAVYGRARKLPAAARGK